MLTTCLEADNVSAFVPVANADAVADNALRDPARDVKPSGKPRCKNVAGNARARPRTPYSSPAVHNAASKIQRFLELGAGPRATRARQLATLPSLRPPAAADNADSAHADVPARARWTDTVGRTANAANAAPLAGNLYCNNVLADGTARTAVHSL